MREILFRGKRTVDDEWIEGYYDGTRVVPVIITHWDDDVIYPETLCEFTGIYDKNNVRVFEGDIVKHYDNSFKEFDIGRVFWSQKLCCYRRTSSLPDAQFRPVDYSMGAHCEYEVIGNIYDNPELLEEVENNCVQKWMEVANEKTCRNTPQNNSDKF